MDENYSAENSLDVRSVIAEAIFIYKSSLPIFIGIALVCAIVNEMVGILFGILNIKDLSIVFFLNILVTSWATIAMIDVADRLKRKRQPSINKSLLAARGKYWLFVAVTMSTIILFACGLLLFIIPGLFVATIFIFADILVILENKQYLDAFKRSAELVRPNFWKVLLCLMVIMVVSSIPGAIIQLSGGDISKLAITVSKILSVIVMPFFVIAQVALYYRVKNQPPA